MIRQNKTTNPQPTYWVYAPVITPNDVRPQEDLLLDYPPLNTPIKIAFTVADIRMDRHTSGDGLYKLVTLHNTNGNGGNTIRLYYNAINDKLEWWLTNTEQSITATQDCEWPARFDIDIKLATPGNPGFVKIHRNGVTDWFRRGWPVVWPDDTPYWLLGADARVGNNFELFKPTFHVERWD